MKSIKLFILLLSVYFAGFPQQPMMPPENYQLETTEDFQNHRIQAEKAMRWLMETPIPKGAAISKTLNGFVIEWIKGAPIEIETRIEMLGPMIKQEYQYGPEMLLIYQSGMAVAEIENLPLTSGQKQLVGIHAMINAYQMIKAEAPFHYLDKMEKLQKKGKLAYWVEQKIR
ncbi:MAG: hypothetical protein KDD63_16130 [Bacteroidetes bacterium]|nr:hypothetical protein [Bacteroidota bacterium]